MKKQIFLTAAAVGVIGLAFLGAIILVPPALTKPMPASTAAAISGSGKYIAQLGDCAACHTAVGGQPFAGGRRIESPMGTIFATNITPDPETGIGKWSLDEFRAALVDGVGKGGERLYPAMPYENYRKLSEQDIVALYGYLMHDVPAVNSPVEKTDLMFPFNQRWGMRLWNWVALAAPGFDADQASDDLNRGAYIVDGPGHCAACHSPRNLVMAQDGVQSTDANYLTGGEIDGWAAPRLKGNGSKVAEWSVVDLKEYLTSGRNAHAGTNGEMALVVENSLQFMTAKDAEAVAKYLKSLTPSSGQSAGSNTATGAAVSDTTKMLTEAKSLSSGARLYLDNCSACHFVDGKGAQGVFPSVDKASIVNAKSSKGLLETIMFGAELPSTETRPARLRMPGFAQRLSDEEVAELATFVRGAWSNNAAPVDIEQVKTVRSAKGRSEH
jgi:mono/diheme cytochrome c family protein